MSSPACINKARIDLHRVVVLSNTNQSVSNQSMSSNQNASKRHRGTARGQSLSKEFSKVKGVKQIDVAQVLLKM